MNNKGAALTSNFLNKYDELQFRYKGSDFYDDKLWTDMYKSTSQDLDTYINLLGRQDKLDKDYMESKYNFSELSSYGKLGAMTAELDANRTDKKNYSFVVGYDEYGKEKKETYNLTEYEYYQRLLEMEVNAIKEKHRLDLLQEQKDNLTIFEKLWNTNVALFGEFALGATDFVYGLFNLIDAVANADDLQDFRSMMSDTRLGQLDTEWYSNYSSKLRDWENRASYLGKTTGERTWLGRTLGSAAYSIGQGMAAGGITSGISSAANGVKSIATAGKATSKLLNASKTVLQRGSKGYTALYRTLFYTGVSSAELTEKFKDPTYDSTSTMAIVGETALKATGQVLVESSLEKFLGGSYLDELTHGVTAGKSTKYPMLNAVFNVAKEGAEEGLQEFSDWAIDAIIAHGDENNPFYSKWSWQNFGDAIISGMMASAVSGITNSTIKSIQTAKAINKLGIKDTEAYKQISDKQGKRKYAKNVFELLKNYNEIVNSADYIQNNSDEQFQLTQQMYNSFNIIMSMYGSMGQERASKAEQLLKELETAYNNKYSEFSKQSRQYATSLLTSWENISSTEKINTDTSNRIKEKLNKLKKNKKISDKTDNTNIEIRAGFDNGKFVGNKRDVSKLTDKATKTAEELAKNGTDVLITNDKRVIGDDEVITISADNLNNMSVQEIAKAAAEDDVVTTLANELGDRLIVDIANVYQQIYPKSKNDSIETILYKLLYDGSTFNTMLLHSSSGMFKFMVTLDKILESVSKRDLTSDFNKQYLIVANKLKNNLGKNVIIYLCNHIDTSYDDLQFLTKEQRAFIERNRYNGYVRMRVADGKTTEQDENILSSRINSAPFATNEKKNKLRTDLKSNTKGVRLRALRELDEMYDYAYFGVFNDIIYPAGTDIKNCIFTDFLMTNNLDLRYFKNGVTNDDLKQNVISSLGVYNEVNKIAYLAKLFETFTGNNYTIKFSRAPGTTKLIDVLVQSKTDLEYDYTTGGEIARLQTDIVVTPKTTKLATDILSKNLTSNLTIVEKAYITFDDVIKYPNKYLSKETLSKIKNDYGIINKNSVLTYFREVLSDQDATIVETVDGNYTVAVYNHLDNFVKDKLDITKLVYDKNYTAEDFYKIENIPEELRNVNIIFEKSLYNPYYYQAEKTIHLPKPVSKSSFKTTLMHEMYHAMSVLYNFSAGFSSSIPVTQEVVNDVKRHVPDLFENVNVKDYFKTVQNYIYANVSGELLAYGTYNIVVDVVPIVFDNKTNTLKMPWGTKYYVGKNIDIKPSTDTKDVKAELSIKGSRGTDIEVLDDEKIKAESSIDNKKDITKQEYDEAIDYLKKINNALQLVKTSKNPEKSMEKVDLPDETKQKILDNTYYKSKDATYSRLSKIKRAYEAKQAVFERKKAAAARKKASTIADDKRIAISKKLAGETNLKYFVDKPYPIQRRRNFINFVVDTTNDLDKLPEELSDGILKGTLSQDDVYQYIRTATEMNDYTFDMIKKHFFPNTPFNSYKDLSRFLTVDLPYLQGVKAALVETGNEDLLSTEFKYNDYTTYVENGETKKLPSIVVHFLNIDETKPIVEKVVKNFNVGWSMGDDGKWSYGDLDINYGNGQLIALKYFTGTVFDASIVANKMKWATRMGYATTAAERGKTSLDKPLTNAKGEEGDTYHDLLGEDETTTSQVSLEDKRRHIIEKFGLVLEKTVSTVSEKGKLDLNDVEELMYLIKPSYINYTKKEKSMYASKVLNKIYNVKTNEFDASAMKEYIKSYAKKITSLNEKEVNFIYTKFNLAEDFAANEIVIDEMLKAQELNEGNRTLKTAKDTYNNLVYRNIQYVNTKNYNYLPDEYKKFFVVNKNKVAINKDLIKGKSVKQIDDLRTELKTAFSLIRKGYFENIQAVNIWKRLEREREKRLKAEKKSITKISNDGKVNYVTNIASKTFEIQSNIPIPDKLKTFLDTTFDKERKSTTKFVTKDDEKHMVISSTEFFKRHGDELDKLTVDEVEEIVNYYSSAIVLPGNITDIDLIRFDAFKTMLYAHFIDEYNAGKLLIDDELVSNMKSQLEFGERRFATNLTTWRHVLKYVDPDKIHAQQVFHELGIELEDAVFDPLYKAVRDGNLEQIQSEQKKLYERMLKEYKGSGHKLRQAFDKIKAIQRAAQLSGPSTIVRAHTSNMSLQGINKLSDWIASKLAKGSKKAYTLPNQYNLTGVKVTEDVKTWIDDELINNGYLDLITDGLSKFDIRDLEHKNGGTNSVVDLIITNITSNIKTQNVLDNKYLSKWTKIVSKLQSDAPYIKKQFKSYLGRILVSTNVDYSQGIKSPKVLDAIVSAYNMAAYDYVHRKNWISDVEGKFAQKAPKAYMCYKLVMPYMPSTYNWFIEMLDLTPFALIKNIRDLCQLEKKVAAMENLQQKGEYVPYDPRFVEMITRRKVGKGVLGTILFALGIGLGALGLIDVDDEDDKLKLFIPGTDIRIDISKQYGTSSLLIGAQFANPTKGDWFNVIEDVFNMTLEDWTLTSIIDTFRYSNGVFDALSEMPINVASGFIPNLYKAVVRMINYKKISYSKGFVGNLEYLAYSLIPGSYNWLSTSIDPYTGEEQVRYSNSWYVNILNEFLPTKLYTYKISNSELIARSYGVNKTELKGEYEDTGKLDKVMLNKKYGELNKKDLDDFINNKTTYEVENKNGKKVKLNFSKMNDEQKESVLNRIMTKNAQYAKIYVWTQSGHKYYCSSSKRAELIKVGITQNILIGNKGFVN